MLGRGRLELATVEAISKGVVSDRRGFRTNPAQGGGNTGKAAKRQSRNHREEVKQKKADGLPSWEANPKGGGRSEQNIHQGASGK